MYTYISGDICVCESIYIGYLSLYMGDTYVYVCNIYGRYICIRILHMCVHRSRAQYYIIFREHILDV
jgi:hypothetical protein